MADEDDDLFDILGPEPEPMNPPFAGGEFAEPEPKPKPKFNDPRVPGGREALARSRSMAVKPRKLSNERMIRVLTAISEIPVAGDACMLAGISPTTLNYWRLRSKEGAPGDGYDVTLDPNDPEDTVRFHVAWDDAMTIGLARVERAGFQRALGYLEPQTFQGRVVYKHDPELVALFGYECMQTYLLDKVTGAPVPETLLKQDPDMIQFIMKNRLRELYGNVQQIDINHRGGVLVVSAVAKTSTALLESAQDFKAEAVDAMFEELPEPVIPE
jgi:hypothetical protein